MGAVISTKTPNLVSVADRGSFAPTLDRLRPTTELFDKAQNTLGFFPKYLLSNRLVARSCDSQGVCNKKREKVDRKTESQFSSNEAGILLQKITPLARQINCLNLESIASVCIDHIPALVDMRLGSLYVLDEKSRILHLVKHNHPYPINTIVSLNQTPPTPMIIAVSTKEALEGYARAHHLGGMSAARIAHRGELRYALLLGVYETQKIAVEATTDLPAPLNELGVWVRSLGSLQQAIIEGNDLAGGADL